MFSCVRVVRIAAAIAVLAGCSETTGLDGDGVVVTIELSQQVIAAGDTVEILVVAVNASPVEQHFVTNACVLVVRVLDQSGAAAATLPDFCNAIRLEHTLGPGESVERVAHFDGTLPTGEVGVRVSLEPGVYTVIGGISVDLLNPSDAVEIRIQQAS